MEKYNNDIIRAIAFGFIIGAFAGSFAILLILELNK